VGVAHVAVLAVDIAEDEVGGLAPYAGEGQEVVHGVGHPAAKAFQQLLRRGDNVTRLGAPEAAGLDVGAYLVHVGAGEVLQGGVTGEEGGGDEVHPCIGALSRQPDGEQQLVVLAVVQRAGGVGVEFF
jgi:hypothetical protein